jgi:hypothetical protein
MRPQVRKFAFTKHQLLRDKTNCFLQSRKDRKEKAETIVPAILPFDPETG